MLRKEKPKLALPSARVFPTIPTNVTRRKDYTDAKITLEDEQGRHADYHSLRATFSTELARNGVTPQVHQKLMRHSDFRTTQAVYTDLGVEDLAAAILAVEPRPKRKRKAR